MITIALGARGALLSLRCTLQRAGSFARLGLIQNTRSGFVRRGQILTRIPKITLLYWGAVNGSLSAVRCQEVLVQPQASEKKSLAKIQVHRLIFFLRLSFRALVLLFKFVPLLLLYPLVLVFTRWMPHWLDALLWVTETSGPTFIKLGQWASTRRDIFSQDFCNRFSRLHVKVRPHSWAHTKQCLRRAFGEGWRRVLVFRSKEPVGSGCIAQVYRGWARVDQVEDPAFQSIVEEMEKDDLLEAWEIPGLGGMARSLRQLWRGSGEEESSEDKSLLDGQQEERLIPVAIKVVHPGVRRQVEIDLLLMKAGSWLLHCLPGLKWLSICEIVEEFEKLMTKQIDLRFEARNIERFQTNFRDFDYVKFPTPLRPFVTRSILVETFEESEPISNYLSSEVPKEVKQRIAKMGVDTLLKMVFLDNFVHGDLHPGNILVQCQGPLAGSGDGTGISGEHHGKTTLTDLLDTVVVSVRPPPCPIQLVLLDAGIVAQLSDRDLANFKAVFTAVVLRQGERVAELILNHARANECKDAALFKKEMAELVDHALSSNTLSLGKVQVADLLSRVFGLLIKHKVKLESNFSSIIFAIMVLEGLGRSLDPNLDILDLAKPLLLKNCASLL
ncbi:putative aarF domain-containing protein kinase 2 isoform X1 [Maylandia zebra]|uniref:putative aarF domain-containing protein kinase 2 isoform X1 n=1 Tax=Maylandia zebra TaxID=106582 RepID=UPI00403C9D09